MATLLWFWGLVSTLVCGADAGRLGSPCFETREAASARLSAAGVVAYPVLVAGTGSRNPEAAYRCRRQLGRWDGAWQECRAWWVLAVPGGPDPRAFAADLVLRERVRAVMERAGLSGEGLWGFREHEVTDLVLRWFCNREPWQDAFDALWRCRAWFREDVWVVAHVAGLRVTFRQKRKP